MDSLFQFLSPRRPPPDSPPYAVFAETSAQSFAIVCSRMLSGSIDPANTIALIEKERVTIFNLVPTMAAMLLPAQASAPRDLSSIRAIVFAGSMLPESIREQTMAKLCPDIYEYYGMQETGAVVVSTPEDRKRRPDLVGKQVVFSEIRIADDAGNALGPGELGEILGRSPNAVTAYFDNPENRPKRSAMAGSIPVTSEASMRKATCSSAAARRI